MEQTLSSETSAFKLQTPGKFPKEHRLYCHLSATLWVHAANGAAIFTLLLHHRVAFLRRTATCRPLFGCMLQMGPPSLHYYCAIVLHSCVVLPQGFLDHLNSLQEKIQFTIETEKDGHLPFLDIDIYRKPDGTLGHKVYCKPTHTNLYLQQSSHHHPAQKQSVLTSLIHRAIALCDEASLPQELEFLTSVFKDNG